MFKTLLTLAATAATATTAFAHQLWIESVPGQAAIARFGEYAHNLREASPGLLDRFGAPTGVLLGSEGETPLRVIKEATGFRLSVAEGQRFTLGAAENHTWYRPAARYATSFAAQVPRLALDIVPTGRDGEFQVTHNGQPLSKTKVTIAERSGWTQEAQSDAEGRVSFALPWQGLYVLETSHIDRTAGERPLAASSPSEGAMAQRFDRVHHVTTLSVLKAGGLAALPPTPAATSGK
jgi:hypothetical protein